MRDVEIHSYSATSLGVSYAEEGRVLKRRPKRYS
jgi:hypothetical protein